MDVSVVVPTLNARVQLVQCLDALSEHAPEAEVIVVNGPSTDGTTGMVRDREDVAVLVEIADRNLNVARNAGLNRASGEWIAFLADEYVIEPEWLGALTTAAEPSDTATPRLVAALPERLLGVGHRLVDGFRAIGARAMGLVGRRSDSEDGDPDERPDRDHTPGAVTGPVHRELTGGVTTESLETRSVAGTEITYFDPDNVAFERGALESADGFDEYLHIGGARDLAHRLAAYGSMVSWVGEMAVRGEYGTDGTGRDHRRSVRSLAYRLVKNYGLRPTVIGRVLDRIVSDARTGTRRAVGGEDTVSQWVGGLRDLLVGGARGTFDGLRSRWGDRERHNPNGFSARTDRAVEVYDRR
jgi:glycosyltransferase involved in cell wall biosynthesis